MKKAILFLSLIIFYCPLAVARSNADLNGKKVREIKIKTSRISPGIVRKKFLVKEDDTFFEDNYDTARQALHDPRMVPGAAAVGSVAPMSERTSSTTRWPLTTTATSGPLVMYSTIEG